MAIRSKEFVGIAEGIKSHELSTKGRIESLRGTISELSGAKRSLESQISYLEAALAAAYEDTDEDGDPDYGRISAIEAQISQTEGQLSEVEGNLDDAHDELTKSEAELDGVIEEKARTLFEIQERARKTSNNIAVASGMYGAYSGVGSSLQSSMQTSLASLSQAASILDGSVDGFTEGSSGGGSSTGGRGMISQGELSTSALSAFTVGAATSSVLIGNTSPASVPSSFTTNHMNGATPATMSGFRSGQQSINPQKTLNFNSEQSGNSYVVSAFSDNDGSDVASKPSSKPSDYRSSQIPSNMEARLSSDSKAPGGASNDPRWDDSPDTSAKPKSVRTTPVHISSGNSYNLSKNVTENIRKTITYPHCEIARWITQIAQMDGKPDDTGKNFTSHNEDHSKQVRQKLFEALVAIVNVGGSLERKDATGDIHFNTNVTDDDFRVAQVAAEVHDTGMSDHGYAFDCIKKIPKRDSHGNMIVLKQNYTNFDSVRENHSVNSALNVLRARNYYKELGFNDAQIDEMAVLVYVHSKSNSGVADLNNSTSWKECFDRIDAIKNKFNDDHPNRKISFDRSHFEGKSNAHKLGSLASLALALRVGDVSRDSGPGALSQSGEVMTVKKKERNVVESPKNWSEETQNFEVKRDNTILEIEPLPRGTSDPQIIETYNEKVRKIEKSKQVHIGEQNIVDNHTACIDGMLTHTVTVNQGNHAPYCTAEALSDHFGELCSAYNLKAVMRVEFNDVCSPETQHKYNVIRKKMYKDKEANGSTANVIIEFPWD